MKKNTLLHAKVAGLLMAMALLAGCYAPLANQNGYLNLSIEGGRSGTNEAIVMVVDATYKDTFKEFLWLIDKGQDTGNLSSSDLDRMAAVGKILTTSALVKFGGFPFFQINVDLSSKSFTIPGLPAGRDYLVKFIVFNSGYTFNIKDIDEHFGTHIQVENRVFDHNEDYASSVLASVDWRSWNTLAGQQVTVNPGQSTTLNVGTLLARTP
jgi:hypothetical protein